MLNSIKFDLDLMTQPNHGEAVYMAALDGIQSKVFASSLWILPTQGVEGTEELFRESQGALREVAAILERFIRMDFQIECDNAKGRALTLRNFLETFREAADEMANEARERKIEERPEQPADINNLPGEAVRSAFVYFPHHGHCDEKAFSMDVECGGCGVVVKEFRGLQLYFVPRLITKTIEPWTSRQRIIRRIVWVLVWVPVQMIKTITVKCCGDKPVTHIDKRVVRDHELMNFWRCF